MIDYMLVMRASNQNRVEMMAEKFPGQAKFTAGKKAWSVKCDIALPCAFQNELNGDDAKELIANGTWCCCEVSNMVVPRKLSTHSNLTVSSLHRVRQLTLVVLLPLVLK